MDNCCKEYGKIKALGWFSMKGERTSAIFLLIVIFAASSYAAQTAPKHAPDFSLTISIPNSTITAQGSKTYVPMYVWQKNISDHVIHIGGGGDPASWYQITVLLDGSPVALTANGRETFLPQPHNPDLPQVGSVFLGTLKPGKTHDFGISLSDYYDFSSPGDYQITFARGTDPGEPDNVMVQSNTITVTVVPAPESTNTSPSPDASATTPSSTSSPSSTGTSSTTLNPSAGATATVASIPPAEKPKPAFTLNIAADPTAARLYPSLHRIAVTFTNTSPGILMNQFHPESKKMYNMVVTRNGAPVPETVAMKALQQFRKVDSDPTILHPFLLYPGKSITTLLDVGDYYNMTEPGTYRITITRQSLPLNPDYSTLVTSNTISMTVSPHAAASQNNQALPKPQPRFDLNLSSDDPYGTPPPSTLTVEMGNLSNRVIRFAKCWSFMGMYNLVVTRDGQPVPPNDNMLQLQKNRAAVTCPGNDTIMAIKPGGFDADSITLEDFYDVSQPGVYQIYVTRQTSPWNPAKSTLVQSNAVSFQLP